MLACLVLNIFKKSQQIHCTAHVTSRASPHWPTQDSTHLIGREWIISPPPRSAASQSRPTLLVETAACPAWARVWVCWVGRLGHSRPAVTTTSSSKLKKKLKGSCRYTQFFWHIIGKYTHCNCKYHWADTSPSSPTSFLHNKLKKETNGYKCKHLCNKWKKW